MLKSLLVQKQNEIEAKSKGMEELFAKAKNDKGEYDATKAGMSGVEFAEKIKSMNDELTALGVEKDKLAGAVQAESDLKRRQDTKGADFQHGDPTEKKKTEEQKLSIGEFFVQSKAYKERPRGDQQPSAVAHYDVEMKTLFERTAGFAPESLRTGRVVPYATRPIQLIDIIPMETTRFDHVKYMEETVFTNAAAEKAEGAAFAEVTVEFDEKSVPIEKITAFLPTTDEQLEDEPRIQNVLENRLMFMLRQRLDYQLIQGSGTPPALMGLLNKPSVQTQAKGSDPVPDAIRKAITKVRVTGRANPNAVILHPTDWQDVRLLRTLDGIYIWGSPSEAGPDRVWGLPVAESDIITENTGVVGDFQNFSGLVTKRGIDVQVGFVNDDFARGRKSLRADMRCAIVWYRAAGFCYVTGI